MAATTSNGLFNPSIPTSVQAVYSPFTGGQNSGSGSTFSGANANALFALASGALPSWLQGYSSTSSTPPPTTQLTGNSTTNISPSQIAMIQALLNTVHPNTIYSTSSGLY